MRALILLTSIAVLLLTGCRTYDADAYFADALDDNWSAASYAGYLNIFSEKPLTEQDLTSGGSLYRLLILQPGDPVHMIKVKIEPDNSATVSVKTTRGGYRETNGKNRDKTYSLSPSPAKVSDFLNELSKYEFWDQEDAPQYDFTDEFLTHPNMFLIEGRAGNQSVIFHDFDSALRKNTADLILEFYEIADLDNEDDWTLSAYFTNFTEQDWKFAE